MKLLRETHHDLEFRVLMIKYLGYVIKIYRHKDTIKYGVNIYLKQDCIMTSYGYRNQANILRIAKNHIKLNIVQIISNS
jgi:hypothetical protein